MGLKIQDLAPKCTKLVQLNWTNWTDLIDSNWFELKHWTESQNHSLLFSLSSFLHCFGARNKPKSRGVAGTSDRSQVEINSRIWSVVAVDGTIWSSTKGLDEAEHLHGGGFTSRTVAVKSTRATCWEKCAKVGREMGLTMDAWQDRGGQRQIWSVFVVDLEPLNGKRTRQWWCGLGETGSNKLGRRWQKLGQQRVTWQMWEVDLWSMKLCVVDLRSIMLFTKNLRFTGLRRSGFVDGTVLMDKSTWICHSWQQIDKGLSNRAATPKVE